MVSSNIKKNFLKIKENCNKVCKKSREYFCQFKYLKKAFIIISLIYLLAFCAIFRANFNYKDDIGRNFLGYQGWDNFSRYTTQNLSTFIHTDTILRDISPLPQIMAIIILSISCCIIIHVFSKERKVTLSKILAVLPVGLSPLFLECISYKFDAPYMAISILASVFPMIFIKSKNIKAYAISSVIGTFIMCTTYQASSGIYPVMVIFTALMMWNNKENNKEIFEMIVISITSYVLCLMIFKICIMPNINDYISVSTYPINQILSGSIKNLKNYYTELFSNFENLWTILIITINIGFVCITTIKSKRNKSLSAILTFTALIVSYILAFGAYIFLARPLVSPRSMYGFGVVIAIIAVQSCDFTKKEILIKGVCIALSYCFIVFSFIYGNALAEQKRYTDFRIQLVIQDLNELDIMNSEEEKSIEIKGNIGKSPAINYNEHRMLNKLVPDTFKGDWCWSEMYFRYYFNLKNVRGNEKHEDVESIPIVKENMYHTIRCSGNYICIELKE